MGWYGNWNIKYNGKDSEKFVNLAKMIIPNYVKRFEETEKGVLDCKRSLSWYNADVDIYNTYCNNENENMKSYAESARIRAIQTANSYNDYLQKNSYVWADNMPDDLPSSLSTDIGVDETE